MPITPQDSKIKLTAAQEAEINQMSSAEQISAYLRDCAVDQGLVRSFDQFAPDMLVDVEPWTQPRKFARTVVIQNQKFILEGASEAELDRREIEARKVAEAQPTTDPPARDAAGRFVKQPMDAADAAQQRFVDAADMQLKFQRGEITVQEYIERSGILAEAVEKALDEQGVSEILEERQCQKEIQSWQDATEKFLRSEEGADWPGTEANKIQLGKILQEFQSPEGLPLLELPDRQEAITLAWNYMKEHPELIKENAEIVQTQKLAKATSRSEIDSILGRDARLNSQQIWNSR